MPDPDSGIFDFRGFLFFGLEMAPSSGPSHAARGKSDSQTSAEGRSRVEGSAALTTMRLRISVPSPFSNTETEATSHSTGLPHVCAII